MTLTHSTTETRELVTKREHWHGIVEGHDVSVTLEHDQGCTISVARVGMTTVEVGIFQCHPGSVAEIEGFGREAAAFFAALAVELRRNGLGDLRGQWERHRDELEAMRKAKGQ